jgi:hypothetical protein
MTAIAATCMTVAHPGVYLPTISSRNRVATTAQEKVTGEKKSSMSSGQEEPAMTQQA